MPRSAALNVLKAIPHYIMLIVYFLGAAVVALIGWFAVMFTGAWPRGIRAFLVRVSNYYYRVWAYVTMVDTGTRGSGCRRPDHAPNGTPRRRAAGRGRHFSTEATGRCTQLAGSLGTLDLVPSRPIAQLHEMDTISDQRSAVRR